MPPGVFFELMMRGAFFLLLFSYTVYGIILAYHWLTYGTTYRTSISLMIGYVIGGIISFALMAPAIF